MLDVEVMSKECRECIGWRGKEKAEGFENWWEAHQHKCHLNFEGSSGAMDAAGCIKILGDRLNNMTCVTWRFLVMETVKPIMNLQKHLSRRKKKLQTLNVLAMSRREWGPDSVP